MSKLPKRILHIDDDSVMREMIRTLFERAGNYELKSCASGQEALDKVQHFRPDLILLDFRMPLMNGAETLDKLREQQITMETPVIFMTGLDKGCSGKKYTSRGVIGVIRKPFSPGELVKTIYKMWLKKEKEKENV